MSDENDADHERGMIELGREMAQDDVMGRYRGNPQQRTKAERIARLRQRLDKARDASGVADVLKGVLDLLSDEL